MDSYRSYYRNKPRIESVKFVQSVAYSSSRCARIFEFGIKSTPALSREIHEIPDRGQLVDAAFLDIGSQPRMPGIRVTDRTVAIAAENGYRGILVSFSVFAAE